MSPLDLVPVRVGHFGHAKKFDAVAGPLQQGQQLGQLRNGLAGLHQGVVRKLDHQIAFGHTAFGQIHGDPVVRQAWAREHQLAGLKRPDPIAHKHFARGGRDEVQLVFVVVVPTRQRCGKTVRQATHKTHIAGRLVAHIGRTHQLVLKFGLDLAGHCAGSDGHGWLQVAI